MAAGRGSPPCSRSARFRSSKGADGASGIAVEVLADGRSRPAAHLDRLGEEDKIAVCVLAEGRSRQVLTSSLDERFRDCSLMAVVGPARITAHGKRLRPTGQRRVSARRGWAGEMAEPGRVGAMTAFEW